jgi:predicted ATPase
MIRSIQFFNYRNHADTEIALRPLTLLVGPAGAGKSNIIKGLLLAQNSIHRSLVELFPPGLGDLRWVRSRWAGETDPVGFRVEVEGLEGFEDQQASYTLKIAEGHDNLLYVLEESLSRRRDGQAWDRVFERRRQSRQIGEFGYVEPTDPTILNRVIHRVVGINLEAESVRFAAAAARTLSRTGYFHLEVSQLKRPGGGQSWDRIGYYGDRLPDFIGWIKSTAEGVPIYEAILRDLREVLPDLETIIVTQVGTDRQGIAMSFRGHTGYIPAPDLSDGTMLTLGLLCIVHGPQKPDLLSLEEPETGIHPRRIRWLFDKLVELAYPREGRRPVQVLLTTHSPYLVDLFREMPDAVQVVERPDRGSRVTPLLAILQRMHLETPGEHIGQEWATGLYEGL